MQLYGSKPLTQTVWTNKPVLCLPRRTAECKVRLWCLQWVMDNKPASSLIRNQTYALTQPAVDLQPEVHTLDSQSHHHQVFLTAVSWVEQLPSRRLDWFQNPNFRPNAWWQRHMCLNHLPKVAAWQRTDWELNQRPVIVSATC